MSDMFHPGAKLIIGSIGNRCFVMTDDWPGFTGRYAGTTDVPSIGTMVKVDLDNGVAVIVHSHQMTFIKDIEDGDDPLAKYEDEPPPPTLKPEYPSDVRSRGLPAVRFNGNIEQINNALMLDRLSGVRDEIICTRYGVAPSEIEDRFRAAVDTAVASKQQDKLRAAMAQMLLGEIEHINSWERNMVQRGHHRSQAVDKDGKVHTLWEDATDQDAFIKFKDTKLRYLAQLKALLGIDSKATVDGSNKDEPLDLLITALTDTARDMGYLKAKAEEKHTINLKPGEYVDAPTINPDE